MRCGFAQVPMILVASLLLIPASATGVDSTTLETVLRRASKQIEQGDASAAASTLGSIAVPVGLPENDPRIARDLAVTWLRIARQAQQSGDSVVALDGFIAAKKYLNLVAEDGEHSLPPERRAMGIEMSEKAALKIGKQAFLDANSTLTNRAWSFAAQSESQKTRASATLGLAWATQLDPEASPVQIGEQMLSFAEEYSGHTDAGAAAEQAVKHFLLGGDFGRADRAFMAFVNTAASTDSASGLADEIVNEITAHADRTNAKLEIPALLKWLRAEESRASTAPRLAVLLLGTPHPLAAADEDRLLRELASLDESGEWVRTALERARLHGGQAESERLAITILTANRTAAIHDQEAATAPRPANDSNDGQARTGGPSRPTAIALFLASQELVQTRHLQTLAQLTRGFQPAEWTQIPMSSDAEYPAILRTHRIIAESLTQAGENERALSWWSFVVDQLGDTAFTASLRLAESASHSAELREAELRLNAARKLANGIESRRVVLDLIAAELAIRGLRFDIARANLESVVRNRESSADLRGRAQWLIGETHFMQQNYDSAIRAYQAAEGMAPGSDWAAASLVQAGKAFEQLGRTRAASICYGNLIERFADSPHADTARSRLAAQPVQPGTSESTLRR
ncbi:MAG: hypothetical protein AAGA03_07880 [Planctomycetota bacterium]